MNDAKNILIAWASASASVVTDAEPTMLVKMISAIILPIIFFTVGKTVDVLLQIYFRSRDARRKEEERR